MWLNLRSAAVATRTTLAQPGWAERATPPKRKPLPGRSRRRADDQSTARRHPGSPAAPRAGYMVVNQPPAREKIDTVQDLMTSPQTAAPGRTAPLRNGVDGCVRPWRRHSTCPRFRNRRQYRSRAGRGLMVGGGGEPRSGQPRGPDRPPATCFHDLRPVASVRCLVPRSCAHATTDRPDVQVVKDRKDTRR